MTKIADNVAQVREKIATACARANRSIDDVQLIAISKRQPVNDIMLAADAGVQHFGENRVEEVMEKIPLMESNQVITWHMVGHIQSRKAKFVPSFFDIVHSVDSVQIAQKLANSVKKNEHLRVLIQANMSGEETKSGFNAVGWRNKPNIHDMLWQQFREILAIPQIHVLGLMTMAPIVTHMEQTRPVFADLVELRDALAESFEIPLSELSMGMTDDFPIAVEEGATMVRVGRAIFGERE